MRVAAPEGENVKVLQKNTQLAKTQLRRKRRHGWTGADAPMGDVPMSRGGREEATNRVKATGACACTRAGGCPCV